MKRIKILSVLLIAFTLAGTHTGKSEDSLKTAGQNTVETVTSVTEVAQSTTKATSNITTVTSVTKATQGTTGAITTSNTEVVQESSVEIPTEEDTAPDTAPVETVLEIADTEVYVEEVEQVSESTLEEVKSYGEGYYDWGINSPPMKDEGYEIVNLDKWDIDYNVTSYNPNFKAYMPYTAITNTASAQYKLLNGENAYTDSQTGARMVNGRYAIAVGSGYTSEIGDKIDVYLSNGVIIHCILGDVKADCHTDSTNTYNTYNGNVVEFIVDYAVFNDDGSGSCSRFYNYDFGGDIISVRVM